MIHSETRGTVAIMRLEYGKVNLLDADMLSAIIAKLEELEKQDHRALVLTGAGSTFSAGVDLFKVLNGGGLYLQKFIPLLSEALLKLFVFPKPVVAAVNGHAVAGGCILACACDHRLMAEGSGRIGVAELQVGVPFPALPLEIMRFAVDPRYLQEMVYTGNTYSPAEARERGIIDEVVKPEALLDRTLAVAERLGTIPTESFRLTKLLLRQPAIERSDRYAKTNDPEAQKIWASLNIQNTIRDYLQRTVRKKSE
ncbi:MAG TPA: enoyl-CoA hydratase/isomerase family protein [bacterium]